MSSCETITDWTESVVTGDDAIIEENENDQELVSDEVENRDPTLAEILADSENEENFEVADEKLSPVPAKDYDSVLIDENKQTETLESANLSDSSEVLQESTSEIVENNRDNSEVVEDVLKETDSFKAPESLITSLDLKEKIQFRVATINFRSGPVQ